MAPCLRFFLPFLLFLFAFSVLTTGCRSEDERRDIRDYYFPLKGLKDGLVYEYQPVGNDSLSPGYWYYRSFLFRDSAFLTGTYYEQDLLPLQYFREEVVDNGMLLLEMNLYERDSAGEQVTMPVSVISGSAFPFTVRDSGGIFLYKVRWSSPLDPGATMTLIKNRRFAGDTTFVFEGKSYDCVVFEVRELLEYDKEGVLEQEYSGLEFYARNLGLVYYRKNIARGLVLEYRLARRYPMEDLEEKFLDRYHPDRVRWPERTFN